MNFDSLCRFELFGHHLLLLIEVAGFFFPLLDLVKYGVDVVKWILYYTSNYQKLFEIADDALRIESVLREDRVNKSDVGLACLFALLLLLR